jgi:hypothetical protein
MTKYSWDSQILHEIESELKPKLEQSWYYSRILTATESILLVQILRDLSNLKDQIKKERV